MLRVALKKTRKKKVKNLLLTTVKHALSVSLYEGIIFLSYFKEKRIKKCQKKDVIQFKSYRMQGDSGHAQVNMVTDVYSHILDDDRRKNAELFEEAFYEKKNLDPQMHVQQENNNATVADEVDPELLAKVLANPEMRALLNSLAKTMK